MLKWSYIAATIAIVGFVMTLVGGFREFYGSKDHVNKPLFTSGVALFVFGLFFLQGTAEYTWRRNSVYALPPLTDM